MLAVPHEQPLAGGVFPPVGVLVLIQRVHAVVAVYVGEQELHAVGQQRVALAHGDAVYVGYHRSFGLHAVLKQQPADFAEPPVQHIAVNKVAEVQIVGRNAHFAIAHELEKPVFFFGACRFQKLLDAEPGLAVPAEPIVLRPGHDVQHSADVVYLALDDPLLQVGVADIGVRMVDDVYGFNLVRH